jgi:hypothetical protein
LPPISGSTGDAKANAELSTPVVFSLGTFEIDTLIAWLLGCLLPWIVFLPLYMQAGPKAASPRCDRAVLAADRS